MENNRRPRLPVNKAPKSARKAYNSYKSSDRRIAASVNPSMYMNQNQLTKVSNEIKSRIKTTNINDNNNDNILSSKNNTKTITRIDPKTGKVWHDKSLITWDPSHFRLFVGNIGPDVDEELLIETFIKYPSLSKVKVPMDEKLKTNKGYAFISFADPNDYLKCFKEMNGKYVGLKPITLERAKTELGEVIKLKKNNKLRR